MNVINPCSLMTKSTPWSSLHYQVKIAGKYALMPDAKIACPFAGVISITKPELGHDAYMCKNVILGLLYAR